MSIRFGGNPRVITIFHVLPLMGLLFGGFFGFFVGSHLGKPAGIIGAIVGGAFGLVFGRVPFILEMKSFRREFRSKTTEELRVLLRDASFPAPNALLLELDCRGEDLEREMPVVLDMLTSSDPEMRIRGWHALASAFPERAKLLGDYRINDSSEECRRKLQRLSAVRQRTAEKL